MGATSVVAIGPRAVAAMEGTIIAALAQGTAALDRSTVCRVAADATMCGWLKPAMSVRRTVRPIDVRIGEPTGVARCGDSIGQTKRPVSMASREETMPERRRWLGPIEATVPSVRSAPRGRRDRSGRRSRNGVDGTR